MKSLLSISLLSLLLNTCGTNAQKQDEAAITEETQTDTVSTAVEPQTPQPESATKPAMTSEMPDTSRRQIIEHGAPDKARNDSVKAAKTKGKF